MTDEKPAVKHYETMNGISIYRIPLEVLETLERVFTMLWLLMPRDAVPKHQLL